MCQLCFSLSSSNLDCVHSLEILLNLRHGQQISVKGLVVFLAKEGNNQIFPFIDLKVLGGHLSKILTTFLRHFQPFCEEAIKWKAIALIYGIYGFINFSQTLIYKSWTKYIDSSLSSVENPP